MSLVSEINGQAATVEVIVVPSAFNAAVNISPSLPPTKGSLCVDTTVAQSLFMGDGTTWNALVPTFSLVSPTPQLPQLSLSAGGAVTNANWSLQRTGNIVTMTMTANIVVAIAGSGNLITSTVGAVPFIYRPLLADKIAQCPVSVDGTVQTGSVKISTLGTLTFYSGFGATGFGTGPGNNGVMQCSVSYAVI